MLNDGRLHPPIGFGTYPLFGTEGVAAMTSALLAGYRLLDTAVEYANEREVGASLRQSGVPRDEVWLTSKVPARDHGREAVKRVTQKSLELLGVDYLDLQLIHWPNPRLGLFVETWEGLIELQEAGLVRSIGVSNFVAEHLRTLVESTGVTPAVNQIEVHPAFPQTELRSIHEELGILTQSWSPLGLAPWAGQRGEAQSALACRPVLDAASRHSVSPAQIVLRWHVQQGCVPIAKSASETRQRENLDVFAFELSPSEMERITKWGANASRQGRLGADPLQFEM